MCLWIPLAPWLQRSHNHHDDNYVGKCGYKGATRWKKKRERERESKRSEDGPRFHRWPAASSFDPSLIILVSTELIATHVAFPFDRSCFFIPLQQPIAILPAIVVSSSLPLSRFYSLANLSPSRKYYSNKSVTWDPGVRCHSDARSLGESKARSKG